MTQTKKRKAQARRDEAAKKPEAAEKAEAAKKAETAKKVEMAKKTEARTEFKVSTEPYDIVVPEGFNFEDFKPLKKKNFITEPLYYEHRIAEMRYKIGVFEAKAEEAKKFGSAAERRQKKQILRLAVKMSELKEKLTEQGIDVEALLKSTTDETK